MRISLTMIVTLLLVMITGIGAADTDNPPDLYNDNCNDYTDYDYPEDEYKCGDSCIPISSHCNNSARNLQCYNSYQDSQKISSDSYFTCPDTCVSVTEEMCRGVNWCSSDVQECGPQLRCYTAVAVSSVFPVDIAFERRPLLSNLTDGHHFYCIDTKLRDNDQVFDSLDRSDEQNVILSEGTSYDIDHMEFQACQENSTIGLTCGSDCVPSGEWCTGSSKTCGPKNINTDDRRLCGNPLVFAKASCLTYNTKESELQLNNLFNFNITESISPSPSWLQVGASASDGTVFVLDLKK